MYSPPPDNSVGPTVRVLAAFALALLGLALVAIAWSIFSADSVKAVLENCEEVRGKSKELRKLLCMASNAFVSSLSESMLKYVEGIAYLGGGVFKIYLACVIWPKPDQTSAADNQSR